MDTTDTLPQTSAINFSTALMVNLMQLLAQRVWCSIKKQESAHGLIKLKKRDVRLKVKLTVKWKGHERKLCIYRYFSVQLPEG